MSPLRPRESYQSSERADYLQNIELIAQTTESHMESAESLSQNKDERSLVAQVDSLQRPEWYRYWLQEELRQVPDEIVQCIPSIVALFDEVVLLVQDEKNLDEIATAFLTKDLIKPRGMNGRSIARSIASAVLGWQTMLYRPAFGTCPPEQLAIADDYDGYLGQAVMTLKQDHSLVKLPLWNYIVGFGLMLPKRNICISEDSMDSVAFEKVGLVGSESLNVALLCSLAGVRIHWIDVLSPRLEFDRATNTLFWFKYPSFCRDALSDSDSFGLIKQ
jgi:hypothetical protein